MSDGHILHAGHRLVLLDRVRRNLPQREVRASDGRPIRCRLRAVVRVGDMVREPLEVAVQTLEFDTFVMGTDKEGIVKLLEEASEVHGAWERGDPDGMADELADVVQAACNLAARYGIDLDAAMERCRERNHRRGRY